ncbi:helix-turn-helix transcriptional regulator [Streptomyces triticirhizae]
MTESSGESARLWVAPELPGVDLLRARYVRRVFIPHTHPTFVIAGITEGVEVFRHRGSLERAGAGGLALINPDVPHTGRAGVPEGWAYGALYPAADVVDAVAAEVIGLRGSAWFAEPVVHDPVAVRLVGQVLAAVEERQALAADSLLRIAVARLLRTAGGARPQHVVRDAGARLAARAREELLARMTDPPTLDELARALDTGPFALLRAFRTRYGMPPHAWLTDARVRRARELLDVGVRPAEAAVAVGFTDQSHLHRHFHRSVGVTPGAYQRARRVRQPSHGRARTYKNDLGPTA